MKAFLAKITFAVGLVQKSRIKIKFFVIDNLPDLSWGDFFRKYFNLTISIFPQLIPVY